MCDHRMCSPNDVSMLMRMDTTALIIYVAGSLNQVENMTTWDRSDNHGMHRDSTDNPVGA